MIDVEELIEEFRNREPLAQTCETPEGAHLRCEETSEAFIKFLRSKNYTPTLIGMRGTLRNSRRHQSFLESPNTEHWLVKVEGLYIDWTIKQIDSEAAVPAIYDNLEEMKCNWEQFTSDPQEVWDMY